MSSKFEIKFETSLERLKEVILKFERVALAFSHQIEDAVTIDLALKTKFENIEFFTLDTHRLFAESLEYQKDIEKFFGLKIRVYALSGAPLEEVEREIGEYGFMDSVEKRKYCCHMRKMLPLKEALSGKDAWISGIRAAQSVTRKNVSLIEDDANFNLAKINPLFDWSDEELWEYAHSRQIPVNPLYAKGFASIGCACCTRAVKKGEDIRAGRWWWEDPAHKECGLHIKG